MRTLRTNAFLAVCGLTALASAQGPHTQPGFVAGGPAAVSGTAHALHMTPANSLEPFVDAYGNQVVMPTNYCGPGGGCPPGMGGYGAPGGNPYGGGYANTEQCGPHYFDFSAEYLHYFRADNPLSESLIVSTDGFANDNLADVPARSVLSGGDLGGADANGYRLTGRIDVGALSVAEFAYTGLYSDDSGNAISNDPSTTFFSLFSRYGTATNGAVGVAGSAGEPTGSDFEETDDAIQHGLDFESEIHSAEATYRRYWVGHNPRVSGTLLIGFRYTSLEQALGFTSLANAGTAPVVPKSIRIEAQSDNYLAGVQVGGDVWVTLLQGFRVGAEGKVGLYNNDYSHTSSVAASDGDPNGFNTLVDDNQAAFLAEGKLMAVADLTPSWSLKAGYEVLFISELALAGDSFALAQPYGDINGIADTMSTFGSAEANGEVFFHGFSAGAEFVW